MNRADHLAWAKKRALWYLDRHELGNAMASMSSDLNKHAELRNIAQSMHPIGMLCVINHDDKGLRDWIEGFR